MGISNRTMTNTNPPASETQSRVLDGAVQKPPAVAVESANTEGFDETTPSEETIPSDAVLLPGYAGVYRITFENSGLEDLLEDMQSHEVRLGLLAEHMDHVLETNPTISVDYETASSNSIAVADEIVQQQIPLRMNVVSSQESFGVNVVPVLPQAETVYDAIGRPGYFGQFWSLWQDTINGIAKYTLFNSNAEFEKFVWGRRGYNTSQAPFANRGFDSAEYERYLTHYNFFYFLPSPASNDSQDQVYWKNNLRPTYDNMIAASAAFHTHLVWPVKGLSGIYEEFGEVDTLVNNRVVAGEFGTGTASNSSAPTIGYKGATRVSYLPDEVAKKGTLSIWGPRGSVASDTMITAEDADKLRTYAERVAESVPMQQMAGVLAGETGDSTPHKLVDSVILVLQNYLNKHPANNPVAINRAGNDALLLSGCLKFAATNENWYRQLGEYLWAGFTHYICVRDVLRLQDGEREWDMQVEGVKLYGQWKDALRENTETALYGLNGNPVYTNTTGQGITDPPLKSKIWIDGEGVAFRTDRQFNQSVQQIQKKAGFTELHLLKDNYFEKGEWFKQQRNVLLNAIYITFAEIYNTYHSLDITAASFGSPPQSANLVANMRSPLGPAESSVYVGPTNNLKSIPILPTIGLTIRDIWEMYYSSVCYVFGKYGPDSVGYSGPVSSRRVAIASSGSQARAMRTATNQYVSGSLVPVLNEEETNLARSYAKKLESARQILQSRTAVFAQLESSLMQFYKTISTHASRVAQAYDSFIGNTQANIPERRDKINPYEIRQRVADYHLWRENLALNKSLTKRWMGINQIGYTPKYVSDSDAFYRVFEIACRAGVIARYAGTNTKDFRWENFVIAKIDFTPDQLQRLEQNARAEWSQAGRAIGFRVTPQLRPIELLQGYSPEREFEPALVVRDLLQIDHMFFAPEPMTTTWEQVLNNTTLRVISESGILQKVVASTYHGNEPDKIKAVETCVVQTLLRGMIQRLTGWDSQRAHFPVIPTMNVTFADDSTPKPYFLQNSEFRIFQLDLFNTWNRNYVYNTESVEEILQEQSEYGLSVYLPISSNSPLARLNYTIEVVFDDFLL